MGTQDLVVTPFYVLIITILSFVFASRLNKDLRAYFKIGIAVRVFSAIAIGFLYQFYYQGGDTFYYFYHSGIIWEALIQDPIVGLKILFGTPEPKGQLYPYVSKMFWYNDPSAFFVGRFGSFFDLFTFHTYTSTALFFALFSFSGSWSLFNSLNKGYPGNTKALAFALLFFPSVVFWGSGFLKDSLSIGATFWLVSILFKWIELRRFKWYDIFLLVGALLILKTVKFYILVCIVPAVLLWVYRKNVNSIRNKLSRLLVAPVLLFVIASMGIFSANVVVDSNSKYAFDRLSQTAAITANDIGHFSGRASGSSYSFGILDGTIYDLLSKAHKSINVSLYRPYLWEVNNPLMLLASIESLFMLFVLIYSVAKRKFPNNLRDPFLLSALLFALSFAFAVGFTYNFGTLMRYRIPMLAFYAIPLIVSLKKK